MDSGNDIGFEDGKGIYIFSFESWVATIWWFLLIAFNVDTVFICLSK